ncbi:sensor histidine kinase [Acidomonas methanolica]|uniref:sensor histidine kinase n=1 Tax=Acidomonas methanolica TaxID=437 RepID=UPI00211A4461|nr:HAMP domain-containing sensor histidine kinase [Acidomonas methanolica]MCQ9155414.1 HAMP domain-containing histidine kinase [Acidomonas methanolica]
MPASDFSSASERPVPGYILSLSRRHTQQNSRRPSSFSTSPAIRIFLTFSSLLVTRTGNHKSGIADFFVGILTSGATTYLALKRSAAQSAKHEARAQCTRLAHTRVRGEMTASIAHEINHLLAAITTSGGACLNCPASTPPNLSRARHAVTRIIDDAKRAGNIVQRVHNLTKRSGPVATWLALDALFDDVLAPSGRELHTHNISVKIVNTTALPMIFADAVQIQQVVLNIFLNAIDSIGDLGRAKWIITLEATKHNDRFIECIICDNGSGIPENMLTLIFEPFHSSKPEEVGLGLAISRSTIEAHGARIWATNIPRGGAAFHLCFYIASTWKTMNKEPDEQTIVYVVDDDKSVWKVIGLRSMTFPSAQAFSGRRRRPALSSISECPAQAAWNVSRHCHAWRFSSPSSS